MHLFLKFLNNYGTFIVGERNGKGNFQEHGLSKD